MFISQVRRLDLKCFRFGYSVLFERSVCMVWIVKMVCEEDELMMMDSIVPWYHSPIRIVFLQSQSFMARYYGQNIEISLNQCHVNIHPFYTKYIPVMYNERCSMQPYASK